MTPRYRPRTFAHFDLPDGDSATADDILLGEGFGEAAPTGLLDRYGRELVRLPEPVGFDLTPRR